jgi:hypothetical protein
MGNLDNIKVDVKGNLLTLTVDLGVTGSPSSSGKMLLLAQSHGWTALKEVEGISLNLMLGKKSG